ncbi:Nn.00g089170.m01.CDS01 [Neocucurbitaria sp. VM-36]
MDTARESVIHDLSGYPSLAAFIASDRDRTTLIYKRFDELAARNLLYLQSELAELHSEQRAFDQEDLISDLDTKQCARSFADFKKAASQAGNNTKQEERWQLMSRIRQAMKEYREALLFESTLASLPRPSKTVLGAFQQTFYHEGDDNAEPFPTLGGHSAGLYDDIDDLVALSVQEAPDRLTNFAQEHLGFLFPDRKRSRRGIAYASDRAISSFIAWFSTFLAALLLIGAIVVLYKVRSPDWRLGLIATFTTLFAGSVGLLTNARRAELFAATAA